jgi:molecular chaperone GrpE (heat shock protein)
MINQMEGERISTPAIPGSGAAAMQEEKLGPLLPAQYVEELRSRWGRIQAEFVDEPRTAVQQADELVAQAIKRLAESFADARNGLEKQWAGGEEASTEDLRLAFRKYRSFFERLLTV